MKKTTKKDTATQKRNATALCTVCQKRLGGFPKPGTTTHQACRGEAAPANDKGGRVSMRAIRTMDCYYCTEPVSSGDHTHCLERLLSFRIDKRSNEKTTYTRQPAEVARTIRAIQKLGRRAAKKPSKVCPVCDVEYQKKGSCCSLVHGAALRRWVLAGKAKQLKDGTWTFEPGTKDRLRSGPGGARTVGERPQD